MALKDPRTNLGHAQLGQIALTAGTAAKPTSFELPLGELLYGLNLYFQITATVGASPVGGAAFTDHILELINNIQLSVNRDGLLVDAPAKALYRRAHLLSGTAPDIADGGFVAGVNTAAAYAMTLVVPIFFADPRMMRPEDTALATDRYSSMELAVNIGAGADLLSTAHSSGGGITLSAMTCDVEALTLEGKIPDEARPVVVQRFANEQSPVDSSSTTRVNLTRSSSRAIKRLWVYASKSGVSARPWSGNGDNAIVDKLSVKSGKVSHEFERKSALMRGANKVRFGIESMPAGLYVHDFAMDGSIWSSLATGDKSELYEGFVEQSGASGTRRVAVCSEVIEELAA